MYFRYRYMYCRHAVDVIAAGSPNGMAYDGTRDISGVNHWDSCAETLHTTPPNTRATRKANRTPL